jgi:hypothetical protein
MREREREKERKRKRKRAKRMDGSDQDQEIDYVRVKFLKLLKSESHIVRSVVILIHNNMICLQIQRKTCDQFP